MVIYSIHVNALLFKKHLCLRLEVKELRYLLRLAVKEIFENNNTDVKSLI